MSLEDRLIGMGLEPAICREVLEQHTRMQSICSLIRSMCERAEENDFNVLIALVEQRQQQMQQVAAAQDRVRPYLDDLGRREDVNDLFAPLVSAIQEGDAVLLRILRLKRELIVEKSKEALIQMLVADYTE